MKPEQDYKYVTVYSVHSNISILKFFELCLRNFT